MKTIIVDGVEYELVPVKKEEKKEEIVDEYTGIKTIKPEVYDWKEELARKRRKNMENSVLKKVPRQDSEMDKFGSLVVGEGIKQDI